MTQPQFGHSWNRRTTYEQRAAMRKQYEEDEKSIATIAREAGLSTQTVARALRDAGTEIRPARHNPRSRANLQVGGKGRGPLIDGELAAEMRTWYERDELTIEQVAARVKVSMSAAYGALRRAGTQMRSTGRPRKVPGESGDSR